MIVCDYCGKEILNDVEAFSKGRKLILEFISNE